MMKKNESVLLKLKYLLTGFMVLGLLASCAPKKEFFLGQDALRKQNWDQAVDYFLKALDRDPENAKYRIFLAQALISSSNSHLALGKQLAQQKKMTSALREFEKALELNPDNNEAREHKHRMIKEIRKLDKENRDKTELEQLKESSLEFQPVIPRIDYADKRYELKFVRSDIKEIFRAFSKASGVNFVFDNAFKTKRARVTIINRSFRDTLDELMLQGKMFYKVLNPKTILLSPDTPAKRKQYEELVMQTFYVGSGDSDEIMKMVRTLTGLKSVAVNKDNHAIVVKGTPGQVQLAGKIIQAQDHPKGEVFIDLEVIEANRSRMKEYGIELSQYQVTESYSPVTSGEEGAGIASSASGIRLNMLGSTDTSDYLLSLPSITYKLLKSDRNSRIKARPQLRVVDGKKVEIRLGDKVPIPTTSFVPYNTGGPAQQPITSYQLQDVGLTIEVTPRIHHDGTVTMELKFELSFITDPGSERLPPTIGNRTVNTTIKLRDSETSILAGLLRDTERKSIRGFPYLSQIPILKEIFAGNRNEVEQTDIVLTITPRIVRFPEIRQRDMEMLWVGTLQRVGLKAPPPLEQVDGKGQPVKKKDPAPANIKKGKKGKKKKGKKRATAPGKKKKKAQAQPPGTAPKGAGDVPKDAKGASTAQVNKTKTTPQQQPQAKSSSRRVALKPPTTPVKQGDVFPVSLVMEGKGDIKIVKIELELNPRLVEVKNVIEGKWLKTKDTRVNFFKTFDNKTGKVLINFTMDTPPGEGPRELAVIQFTGKEKGMFTLAAPLVFEAYDSKMKRIPASFSGIALKIN